MSEQENEIMELIIDEETLEISVFVDCRRSGRCPSSAFLEFQRNCKEAGLEIEPLPGKGPFDFDFQIREQMKQQETARLAMQNIASRKVSGPAQTEQSPQKDARQPAKKCFKRQPARRED